MNQYYIIIGIAILVIWLISFEVRHYHLRTRIRALFQGKNAKDLESLVTEISQRIEKADKDILAAIKRVKHIEDFMPHTIHKTALIRFNPFKTTGGNQSFSLVAQSC